MPIFIPGPAGRLEALFQPSRREVPPWAIILCHPHPLYGGTMHNKVVFHMAKIFHAEGLPTLRFNFRGVSLSQGAYDGGLGETDDVIAAVDYMAVRYPQARPLIAGFSFGAWVGLQAACRDGRVRAAIALGMPFTHFDIEFLSACRKPKLFLHGTEDEFSPMAAVERVYPTVAEPKQLVWIVGAHHFFEGRFPALARPLTEFLHSGMAA